MVDNVTSTSHGRNLRVEINFDDTVENKSSAIKALIKHAKSNHLYQGARKDFELRVIQRGGKTLLELHTRDFISRTSSFLKGALTGSRTRRAEEREAQRAEATRFLSGLIGSDVAKQAEFIRLKEHLRGSTVRDPVAAAARDRDRAGIARDVTSAMIKLKAYLGRNPQTLQKLSNSQARDQWIYAKWHRLQGHNPVQVLDSWKPNKSSWSTEDTCGFMLDIGLNVTRVGPNGEGAEEYVRKDLFSGSEFSQLLGESKEAANAGDVYDSTLANEFFPAGVKLQSGASASTQRLLELLSRVEEITPTEIEAVMNGLADFWANSFSKRLKGEFHTTAEVWASYNDFLHSTRIPRDLMALAPQSKALIEDLDRTPEGQSTLKQIHANWQRASQEGKTEEGAQLVQEQLKAYEAGLSDREAVSLYLGPINRGWLSVVPNTTKMNDLISEIRSETQSQKASGLRPDSTSADQSFERLINEIPGDVYMRFYAPHFLNVRADKLPDSSNEELKKIALNLRSAREPAEKANAVKECLSQLRACHKDLLARDAARFLTIPGTPLAGQIDLVLRVTPKLGYDAQLASLVNALDKDEGKSTKRVNEALGELVASLPSRAKLWINLPPLRQRFDSLPDDLQAKLFDDIFRGGMKIKDIPARLRYVEEQLNLLERGPSVLQSQRAAQQQQDA